MVDQAKIHSKVASDDVGERKEWVEQLRSNFADLPDKGAAWEDLIRLTGDEDSFVRWRAASALGSAFGLVPDSYKDRAWQDLHWLIQNESSEVQSGVASEVGLAFSSIPDGYKDQAWQDLIQLVQNEDSGVRRHAASAVGLAFSSIPDSCRDQAWKVLHRLTMDGDRCVRQFAAYAVGSAFSSIPDCYRNQAWEDLHRLIRDENSDVRSGAASAIGSAFHSVPDGCKSYAWQDLIRLMQDKDRDMQWLAASAISPAFHSVPDGYKDQAWQDLIQLTQDEDSEVRRHATTAISSAFSLVPDGYKTQAWQDVHRLTQDKDKYVRFWVASAIGSDYISVPDDYKYQAWHDLRRLTGDEDSFVRSGVAIAVGSIFSVVPDGYRNQAWQDLIRLTQDEDSDVRRLAAVEVGSAFSSVPNSYKDQAWRDLHRLTQAEDYEVRSHAASAVGSAFGSLPYGCKNQAWQDLHKLTQDEGSYVRSLAASATGLAFNLIPDGYKDQAWQDVHRLTQDESSDVRSYAASAVGSAFGSLPYGYKNQAWQDIHRLTKDEDSFVRWNVASAVGSVFSSISDEYKDQAWQKLIWFMQDEYTDFDVQWRVAEVIGSMFNSVSDRCKDQAWQDLCRLTQEDDLRIRILANYSLGKVSILKAIEAEDENDFKDGLKNALNFFEKANRKEFCPNPAGFCHPFYRSFYTITFEKEKEKAEDEIQKYLTEAKSASEGSKNKETLLEAVENLASALTEAHKVMDFGAMKSDLNAYRQYCDRAADLIGDAAEDAPGATGILRRGMPIIGERIRDIQEKAEAVCKQTQGTPLEKLGLETARSAHGLTARDPPERAMALSNMVSFARDWCEYLPTDKKIGACEQLKNLHFKNLTDREAAEQSVTLARVFEYVQENIHIPKIQTVHISETEQEIVRIAVTQISFELTESFPFTVKNKDEVKTKIFSALDIAKQDEANIVCLPELCLCNGWISEIKEKYPDMIVIGGSFYEDNKNICPIIMESYTDIPYQPKITPSPFEDGIMGPRMTPGDRIYRYETRFGKFVILICMDFDDLAHFFRETDIDMIFCPSFNPANERFQNEAHSHVERTPSYILIANTGLHGGTSIFGQLNKNYFGELADGGCKQRKDSTYKLCEVKKGQEEVIIADFNLDQKGAQVPTPSNPNKVMKSVDNIKKIPIQPDLSRI
ncbi:MAG: HEAT repeat domain-containing protein [Methanosarcinales archaeon]|nr:HEAT repeat domain-containing protein [Methanosarcinales archaeon]